MARKNKNRNLFSGGRDLKTPIAKRSLPRLSTLPFSQPLPMPDNRHFFPLPKWRLEATMRARRNILTHAASPVRTSLTKDLSLRYAFKEPLKASPCVRRSKRSQVFHALGLAGRRFGSGGSYRRTENSRFSCK